MSTDGHHPRTDPTHDRPPAPGGPLSDPAFIAGLRAIPSGSAAGQPTWPAADPEGMARNPAMNAGSDNGPPGAGGRSCVGSVRGWCPSVLIGGAAPEVPSPLARFRSPVPDHLDRVAIATPPARHLLHRFVEYLLVLH